MSDAYPMPRIDDLIDLFGKAKYISTLDLTRGYWHVPLIEDARHKMVFVTNRAPHSLLEGPIIPACSISLISCLTVSRGIGYDGNLMGVPFLSLYSALTSPVLPGLLLKRE